MSMKINYEQNLLFFDVPNSEANIIAQHNGIVDRTVGSYYMSENYYECKKFLNDFNGEFYVDLVTTLFNCSKILDILSQKGLNNAFKERLVPQIKQIESLKWYISSFGFFYKTNSPSVNENEKYLKFDNSDNLINLVKSLVLGDLCSVFIKKIGSNGFVIYIDKNENFDSIINSNKILSWFK